jgi:uncharacterized protein
MQSVRIVDGDGHLFEDPHGISKFLPSPYRERGSYDSSKLFPPLDHLHVHTGNLPPGAFGGGKPVGPVEWLQFLEDVGIESTVLYPTRGLSVGKITNLDWAIAVTRAYNDWLHETYLQHSPRFQGVALLPLQEPEVAAAELRRAVEKLGMRGAMLPSVGVKGHLGSKEYWPVYREADRLGCALAVHGGCHSGFGFDDMNVHAPVHALGHPFGIMVSFAGIVFNGTFDRFPNVRFGFLEGGVAWLLLCLERFDRSYETHIPDDPRGELLRLEPGESVSAYLRRLAVAGRLFVGCEGEEPDLAQAIKRIGHRPFMYSSDFPHEVNLAFCRHEIEELWENDELTPAAKQAVLHKNAETFYALQPDRSSTAQAEPQVTTAR